ncbi:MAG: helix-turn-helix domain-containing protein [Candidatus Brevundimonas colombiensis]|uniref:Helix-turn-helix domain-containing protein n=1 Tax=Candidatus Brevundimonas colombiensis TaxID=3121376 RepID=A0AAJ6BIS9_9CAUL|nr:helix-turn-helix domain-containing protein [Brevundimonas sp.]WEK38658.1 MAG: helix-turn-helix domain-containing protein [Brevundimonas sp.]
MRRVLIRTVIETAARLEGLTVDELLARDQSRAIARPRQRAMYVSRQLRPDVSLPRLGRIFGGRDHTTVIHAIDKVGQRIRADADEAQAVNGLLALASDDERAWLNAEIVTAEHHLANCRSRLALLTGERSA